MDKNCSFIEINAMADSKIKSLTWALEELSKQRAELDAKLQVARKRDETTVLINEVNAQKQALETRISALDEGLRSSSEIEDRPCDELEEELVHINEKLEIAQERLHALEQEEYLQELGRKLNRSGESPEQDDSIEHTSIDDTSDEIDLIADSSGLSASSLSKDTSSSNSAQQINPSLPSTATKIMKSSTNRIQVSDTDLQIKEKSSTPTIAHPKTHSSMNQCDLESYATHLGVDPEFLAEKAIQAILRMIGRNSGKLTFPLEVEQVDIPSD